MTTDMQIPGVGDSKTIAPAKRERIAEVLKARLCAWGLGWAWPEEIDRLNIHHASLLAMQRAYYTAVKTAVQNRADTGSAYLGELEAAVPELTLVYVDGRFGPELPVAVEPVVKGDALVPAVAAASILAKTARDAWMVEYARREPQYLFEKHKGYPTPEHKALIRAHGPSRIHRHSFSASI